MSTKMSTKQNDELWPFSLVGPPDACQCCGCPYFDKNGDGDNWACGACGAEVSPDLGSALDYVAAETGRKL